MGRDNTKGKIQRTILHHLSWRGMAASHAMAALPATAAEPDSLAIDTMSYDLGDVTVTAQRKLVKNDIDKLTYDVANDETVGVIAQRDAVRIDFDDLVAQRFHLVPSGGRGQAVGVEERLVVVQHFGGLAHRQRVHLAIAELTAFLVVRGNEVVLLLLRQAEGFGRAVGAGDGRRAVLRRRYAGLILRNSGTHRVPLYLPGCRFHPMFWVLTH